MRTWCLCPLTTAESWASVGLVKHILAPSGCGCRAFYGDNVDVVSLLFIVAHIVC